jgi:hypothetical protein
MRKFVLLVLLAASLPFLASCGEHSLEEGNSNESWLKLLYQLLLRTNTIKA